MSPLDPQPISARRPASPEVMVSYSSQDRTQVLQIVKRLRAAGVAAWIDQGGIDGAQRWGEEIVNAIDACKTVILMISRPAMESENIAKEIALAWENGKKFLPLCLEDAKIPRSMQYQLAGIQHIKLYEGDPEARFISVLRSLARLGIYVSPYYVALIHADAGDDEQAFEYLKRAHYERSPGLTRLKTEPRFQSLRNDPRYADLVAKIEALPPQPEDSTADIPLTFPKPLTPLAEGPQPWWKRLIWPDIANDTTARHAAAQGVVASAVIVAMSTLYMFFANSQMAAYGLGLSTLFSLVAFIPIGIGTQKMGRPAAIAGLVLCGLGTFTNITILTALHNAYMAYAQIPAQYRSQYTNTMATPYFFAWINFLISAASVLAFVNATRGTLAYRQLVNNRQAPDKQDAFSFSDRSALRERFFGFLGNSRRSLASMQEKAQAAVVARTTSIPVGVAPPAPTPINVANENTEATLDQPKPLRPLRHPDPIPFPAPAPAPEPSPNLPTTFRALIGAGPGPIHWLRAFAFIAANLAAGLTYIGIRILTSPAPVSFPGVYWQLAFVESIGVAVAAIVAFRFIRNRWIAAALAAIVGELIALPAYAQLPKFLWGDLVYREEFQQFVLLPTLASFFLIAALALAVQRVQPLPLALWIGAMASEVLTPVVANALRVFGSGASPDKLIAGTSVVFAVLRSLVFASVFWGLLALTTRNRAAPAPRRD